MSTKMLDPNIKVVHTRATDGPQTLLNETDKHIGPVEIRTTYVNYLHKPVVVVERNNLKHIVPSVDCVGRRSFIVRKEIMIHHPTVQEIRRVLSVYNNDDNASLTVIRNSILGVHANQSYRGVKILIDYPISMDVFRENEGTVYCQITDKVLSVLQYDNVPSHPYAVDTINRLELEEITGDLDPNSPTVKIELVDNEHKVSKRFISLLGRVREIKSKVDNTRSSGVYVNTVESDCFREEGYAVIQTYYDLDTIEDQLGIFRTKEEAIAAGDLKALRKENVILKEHENILLSKQAEKEKIENKKLEEALKIQDAVNQQKLKEEESNRRLAFEESRMELERILLERKVEHEKFMLSKKKEEAEIEQRISKLKEQYEQRAYIRKDKYEEKSTFLKSIPDALKILLGIATIIGSIFVAYKKLSSAS